jgi:hypothetical protein
MALQEVARVLFEDLDLLAVLRAALQKERGSLPDDDLGVTELTALAAETAGEVVKDVVPEHRPSSACGGFVAAPTVPHDWHRL